MTNVLNAERIKFFTTRGWLIGALSFAGLSLLLPVAEAMATTDPVHVVAPYAGVLGFALLAAMVVATTLVTQEYRFRTVLVGHQATPARWQPLVAKAVVGAVFGGVLTVVMAPMTALVVNAVVSPDRRLDFDLVDQAGTIACTALTVAIMSVMAVGLGALVRSTPAAVAVIVLWQTPIELLLSMLPGVGRQLQPFLLFNNTLLASLGKTPAHVELHWGQMGALAYLAAIAVTVFLLGWRRSLRPVAG